MATNDSDPSDREQPANYPRNAAGHDHVVNMLINAAGEAGCRLAALLLICLAEAGIVSADQSPVGDISLSVPANPAVSFQASFADVDFQIQNELEVLLADDPVLLDYVEGNLLTLIGGGAGREYRRMLQWFDEYPELDEHLEAAVTADPEPHVTLDIAGAVGATGMGHIRRHFERIREGELPSPADHAGAYLPVTLGPALRLHDQRVQAIDSDHQRRAFDSLFEHRAAFRKARSDGVISGDIFADNGLLAVQGQVHDDRIPLSDLRKLHDPIRYQRDWSNVIKAIQFGGRYEVSKAKINDAFIRSLLPMLYAVIRPDSVAFDQGDSVFDRADLVGHLSGVSWLPGHIWVSNISELTRLVPEQGQPADISDALYPAAQYSAYTTPAGFDIDSAQRALVFIRADGYELDGQDHGTVRRTLADELEIHAADVATVELDNLDSHHFPADNDPDPELAVNTLVGVSEVEIAYNALGEQTL